MQVLLGDFADARDVTNVEGSEQTGLMTGNSPEYAMWLGFGGGDLGDQARRSNADGAIQLRIFLHPLMQGMSRPEGRAMKTISAGHIQIGLVNGSHFYQGRERIEHTVDLLRGFAVAIEMTVDKDGLRAQLRRRA
jgi:hypothetical protein